MSRRYWIGFILAAVVATAFWLGGRQLRDSGRPVITSPPAVAASRQEPGPPVPAPAGPSMPPSQPAPADSSQPEVKPASPTQVFAGPMTRTDAAPSAPPAPAQLPAVQRRPPPAEDPAKTEADLVALNIRSFSQRFGGNPTGTNAEIVKALTGANPGRATYLPAELNRLNDKGELVDLWGTPYFFHQMSADHMEVKSAGPDKQFGTQDDVTAR